MALENQGKESMLSRLTTKQKGMAVGIVVVVLALIWVVMGSFGNKTDTTITPVVPAKPAVQMTSGAPGAMAGSPATAGSMQAPAPDLTPVKVAVVKAPEILNEQKEDQKKYVTTINELQMLKLQRDIAETNQAISAAKLATVTAEKSINDLLVKPLPPAPLPAADYAAKLVTPEPSSAGGPPSSLPPAPIPETPDVSYVVISVSMQEHRWNAVLGVGGKLFNVSIGDVLPADNSIVIGINKSGVILEKDHKKRKVSMTSAI